MGNLNLIGCPVFLLTLAQMKGTSLAVDPAVWMPLKSLSSPGGLGPLQGPCYVCFAARNPLWDRWLPASCSKRSRCLKQSFTLPSPQNRFSKIPRVKAARRRVRQCNAWFWPALPTTPFFLTIWPLLLTVNQISTPFLSTSPCILCSSAPFLL